MYYVMLSHNAVTVDLQSSIVDINFVSVCKEHNTVTLFFFKLLDCYILLNLIWKQIIAHTNTSIFRVDT